MNLIIVLQNEHRTILSLLDDVACLGVGTEEGRKRLLKSKELILAHLHKEDEKLYPKLNKLEATHDVSISFENDMKDVSSFVLKFFCELEKSGDTEAVAIQFKDVRQRLRDRIAKEEFALYPLFEKHVEHSA